MLLPHQRFQELINPNHQVMILLHAHWVALNEIMAFILQQENKARDQKHSRQSQCDIDPGFQRWLKWYNAHVDYEHQIYNQWPMWVEEQVEQDVSYFGKSA